MARKLLTVGLALLALATSSIPGKSQAGQPQPPYSQINGIVLQNSSSVNGNGTALSVVGYSSTVCNVTISGSATVNFEASPDFGVTWGSVIATLTGTTTTGTAATSTGIYTFGNAAFTSIRARISSYSSGTVTVVANISPIAAGGGSGGGGGGGSVTQGTIPWVVGQTTGTNLHTVTDATSTDAATGAPGATAPTSAKLGGVTYNTSLPTLSTGQMGSAQSDINARLIVYLGSLIAGENIAANYTAVEQDFSYQNITGTGTTTIKSGAGFLHCITVNTAGATADTLTVYDNTAGSGTKIATIDTTLTSAPYRLYDTKFSTGLTVVAATGTGADITISYRRSLPSIDQQSTSFVDAWSSVGLKHPESTFNHARGGRYADAM